MAEEKLYEHWRQNNPDLRKAESDILQEHVVTNWGDQKQEKAEVMLLLLHDVIIIDSWCSLMMVELWFYEMPKCIQSQWSINVVQETKQDKQRVIMYGWYC